MPDLTFRELAEAVEDERGPDISAPLGEALALAGVAVPGGDAGQALTSADAALGLAASALPGWSIRLDGRASVAHGHWRCVIRRSTSDDEDAYPGVGKSNRPSRAILAALLRALALRGTG